MVAAGMGFFLNALCLPSKKGQIQISGSIRVFCRVRPFLPTDNRKIQPISTGSEKIVVKLAGTSKEFEFDKVFLPQALQG